MAVTCMQFGCSKEGYGEVTGRLRGPIYYKVPPVEGSLWLLWFGVMASHSKSFRVELFHKAFMSNFCAATKMQENKAEYQRPQYFSVVGNSRR